MKKLTLFTLALLSAGFLSAPDSRASDSEVILDDPSGGSVVLLQFSPDGRTLASVEEYGTMVTVRLWSWSAGSLASGTLVVDEMATFEVEHESTYPLSLSLDLQTMASSDFGGTVRLWEVASGEEKATLEGRDSDGYSVTSLSFSPDGQTLAGSFAEAGEDGTILLLDAASIEEKATLEDPWVVVSSLDVVSSLSFSPNGQTLAIGYLEGWIELRDVASGEKKATLSHGWGRLSLGVQFSPDGQTLASYGGDFPVRLWDVASGQEKAALEGHSEGVTSVSFSPDGQTLASGSWDGTIRLWDVLNGQEKTTLANAHTTGGVFSLSFSLDGQTLASGAGKGTILGWDMAPYVTPSTPTAVRASPSLPEQTALLANYPNPFNSRTQLAYRLAAPGLVRLTVYNALGQPVRVLVEEVQAAGEYRVSWDGRDQHGAGVSAGVYLARLRHEDGVQTRRLLYLK